MDAINFTQTVNSAIGTAVPAIKSTLGIEPYVFVLMLLTSVGLAFILNIKEAAKFVMTTIVIMILLIVIVMYTGGKV